MQKHETAAEFLAELEREVRTAAALAECQGCVFRVEINAHFKPETGRQVAALLAKVRAVPVPPEKVRAVPVPPEKVSAAPSRVAVSWQIGLVVYAVAICGGGLVWAFFNG